MGNFDVQISLQGISNLPEDRFVNTLHYDLGQLNTPLDDIDFAAHATEIWAKYDILRPSLGGLAQAGHKIAFYQPGINASGPVYEVLKSFPGAVGASGPNEVAICLSYAAVDNPDASTPRRRGRIFIGPLGAGVVGTARPSSALRSTILDFGDGLAQVGSGIDATWKMRSNADNDYYKIESIWVDDAWDTQRRRGLAPTLRDKRDVQ